ncbi:ankyrin repeat-containing domain protein [Cenococcum geophilum]
MSAYQIILDHRYQMSAIPQAKILSEITTNPNLENQSFTRLHKCILGLTSETVEVLLRGTSSSEIDETDLQGRSALHLAAYKLNSNVIDVLIAHGAKLDIRDHTGKTPLHVAAALGSTRCTSSLINGGSKLESTDQFGSTPLHHVCMQGHYQTVEFLLDAGANIEAINSVLETPLRYAVSGDHIEVVTLLHQRGAAFNALDKWGSTVLHIAARFNSHRVLRFLLGIKMRVDQRYDSGKTILHILAESGDVQTMGIFLDIQLRRVDVAALDREGWTAEDYLKRRRDLNEVRDLFRTLLSRTKSLRAQEILCYQEELDDIHNENEEFFDAMESNLIGLEPTTQSNGS